MKKVLHDLEQNEQFVGFHENQINATRAESLVEGINSFKRLPIPIYFYFYILHA